jgi:DNA-binding beta-propeller fold protein YncE
MSSVESDRKKCSLILTLLLAVAVSAVPSLAQKKAKNTRAAEQIVQNPRTTFDVTKIVWPSPPEIPRVAFQRMLTGQKIDWAGLQATQKPRQSWMDRLAGEQPDRQVKDVAQKIGFQMRRVYGVAADSKGNIYAADQGVGAIFIFPADDPGKMQMIKNGIDAHLPMVNGLAMDDDDHLFVTDVKLHHVLVFNPKHEPEAQFGAGDLISPAGIAIDTTNRFVYVVDTQADQVVVFDADKYTLLRRIGTGGKQHTLTSPGDFSLPTNVAVDKEGNVYVTDTLNNRVEVFDADGGFVREFGKAGDGPGHFARPKGIAVDSDGHIWVADEVQSRVQVFDKEGQLLIYLGQHGWYPGQFQALYGIAADNRNNRIITSEQFPGRVQVFRYITDAQASAEKARRESSGRKTGPEQKPADPKTQQDNAPAKAPGTSGS